jgi:hypothetical protein
VLAVLLALASAVTYGGSDFAAGLAARKFSIVTVTFLASACSLLLTLAVLPWVASPAAAAAALGWGAAAGLGGMSGALALYAGFRHAAFSVAGPLSAVSAAGLSVIVGVLIGERPAALSLAGIAVALPAIALVSLTADRPNLDPDAGSVAPTHPDTGTASTAHPGTGSASPAAPSTGSADPADPDTGCTGSANPDTGFSSRVGSATLGVGCPDPSVLRILIGSSLERTGSRVREIPEVHS